MAKRYVSGQKSFKRTMRRLPGAITTPVNQASRYALTPIKAATKRNIKSMGIRDTGEYEKSIVIKRDKRSPKAKPRHVVGPRSDSPAVRYAHLQEFGTEPHGDHPGQAPRPAMTQAYNEHDKEAVQRFGEKIGPAFEKQAAKLAKKRG